MTRVLIFGIVVAALHAQTVIPEPDCVSKPITRVWSSVTPAVLKTRVEPTWPMPAINDSQGTMILDAWIDERGNVVCVKVVRSIPINDQAAIAAVRQWKFVPAMSDGHPIAVIQEVRVLKR